jgi:hypothetical protein
MSIQFPSAWCGTDLGPHRPCRGTYEWYPMDSVPPLDGKDFDGSFSWLGDPGLVGPEQAAEMEGIARTLAEAGLTLPADFVRFHTHAGLWHSFGDTSCTACWTHVSKPYPSPVEPGAYLVRFLRDQQDCVLWYLYLRPSGETFVVHSYALAPYLDYLDPAEMDPDAPAEEQQAPEIDVADLATRIHWCAASFEEFAYRFLTENRIWFGVHEAEGLDEGQRAYLEHYEKVAS